jgi:hypothetical protein
MIAFLCAHVWVLYGCHQPMSSRVSRPVDDVAAIPGSRWLFDSTLELLQVKKNERELKANQQ